MNQEVMSFKDWLITLLILMIPCVNIIMMFVWAFGDGNENRKNYCRAVLVVSAIIIVIYFISFMLFGAAMLSLVGEFY